MPGRWALRAAREGRAQSLRYFVHSRCILSKEHATMVGGKSRFARRFVLWFWSVLLGLIGLGVLLLTLIGFGAFGLMPTFEELENPKSNMASEVISEDLQVLGRFYVQNRSYVTYRDLAPSLVDALVATEDVRFEGHSGIDPRGLGRVFVKTIMLGDAGAGGGSTITQQLAKNLFPRDTTHTSLKLLKVFKLGIAKLKEWITAVKLERNYSKEEILTMYLNTVPFGSNTFGIKMAARTFFNTTPDSLRTEEAAVLVGLVKGPSWYSPVRNPERCVERRNVVLHQMRTYGKIDQQQYDSLSQLPLKLKFNVLDHNAGLATYYRELIRHFMTAREPRSKNYHTYEHYQADSLLWATNPLYGWCEKNRKADGTTYNLYRDGLKIYTPINSNLQRYAEESVATHLGGTLQPAFDAEKRKSLFTWDVKSSVRKTVIRNGITQSERYRSMRAAGATKEEIEKAFNTKVETQLFSWRGPIDTVITPKDSMLYMKRQLRCGFVAMEPHTGRVRAYVGGSNFRFFKYDQVYSAHRQIGSTIKPFLYTLAMLEGYSPCTRVPNVPQVFEHGDSTWTPRNSGKTKYDGEMVTLKWGLANSVNNISAWLIKQFSPAAMADMIRKMGVHSYIDEVPSIFLGTSLITNYEMTTAYNVFASAGVHIDPLLVEEIHDRNGNKLAEFKPRKRVVLSPETAYMMVSLLRGVVDHGSGRRLRYIYNLQGPLGGKTGTTQNGADGWFMLIHPKIMLGTWVGAEDPQVHFAGMGMGQGAVMALPIEGLFLQKAYADEKCGIKFTDTWAVPPSLEGMNFDCDQEQEEQPEEVDDFFNN